VRQNCVVFSPAAKTAAACGIVSDSMETKCSQEMFERCRDVVLNECARALRSVEADQVLKYLDLVQAAEKVFFVGVGRVMLSLQAIAKRYNHIGIESVVVGQVTEPAITANDVLVVGSGSGERLVPLAIARKAKSLGARVAHIGSEPESSMKGIADVFVRISVAAKRRRTDDIVSSQPMTTLFDQSLLLLGDITAKMMIEQRCIAKADLWKRHANLE